MAENSCCKPPGVPLTAADVHAAPGWAAIEDWARSKADLVDSLYLLGSRMRRDHVDDSDLDIAMVGGPWTNASLSSLPSELGGACMGWIPLKREWFHPPPQVTGIPWVLLGQGVRLWGRPLPVSPARRLSPRGPSSPGARIPWTRCAPSSPGRIRPIRCGPS